MALQGDLATMPPRQLFGWLADRRATGQLTLGRGMVVRRFHLRTGRVLLASSSEQPVLLGRLLVEEGLVDPGRLAEVLGRRAGSRARLGKALVEAGLVTAEDLDRVLAGKVRRLLRDALTWNEGTFHFDEAARPRRQAAVTSTFDLGDLLDPPPPAPGRVVAVTDADVIETKPLVRLTA